MAITILQSEFVTQLVLPFLLVFTLIFAILDKTKIFGEDKRQINAILSFVIALIFVSFSFAVGITVNLMGVMAVIAVILLVFIILYSFASGGEFKGEKWMKIIFGILIGIALIVTVLVSTGYWDNIINLITTGNNLLANIVFIAVIIAAFAVVLTGGRRAGS